MNNPFHRAAVKAFVDVVSSFIGKHGVVNASLQDLADLHNDFEARLEAQAKAFDACKTGTEISMKALAHEMSHALAAYRKRLKLNGDHLAAERAFNEHMKPHLEIRLW